MFYSQSRGCRETCQWTTTNMDYGNFYTKWKQETEEKDNLHGECKKKIDALAKELQECREKLRQLGLQLSTSTACGPQRTNEVKHPSKMQSLGGAEKHAAAVSFNGGKKPLGIPRKSLKDCEKTRDKSSQKPHMQRTLTYQYPKRVAF